MNLSNAKQISEILLADITLESKTLDLNFGRCTVRVLSNSLVLINHLEDYFSHCIVSQNSEKFDITVIAVEGNSIDLPVAFYDWKREAGKSGRKDSVYDTEDARLIKKVRTGMLFLQSDTYRIAIGSCLNNSNQIINFINNQYMTWLQQKQWLNCHAAAVVKDGQAYAVAGFSGGGKSTLMLQMLENTSTHFLSNDRLFIQAETGQLKAVGIAKMPRINPGTIIHNPRLAPMISHVEREKLLALPAQTLWDLEQKYDVDIDAMYGEGRIKDEAPLKSFLVLNWQRDAADDLSLKKINLRHRKDLLQAIMKSPGPFYQLKNGRFSVDQCAFDQEAYLKALDMIDIYEATGRVDFPRLAEQYLSGKES